MQGFVKFLLFFVDYAESQVYSLIRPWLNSNVWSKDSDNYNKSN